MAYGIKYKIEYNDSNNVNHRVELLQNNYIDTAIIDLEKRNRDFTIAYKESEDSAVIGSTLSFNFVTKNKADFSEFLTADAKEFKVIYKQNNNTVWSGWLEVDNINTSYFNNSIYEFNLQANDNLAQLKKQRIEVSNTNNTYSLLHYLKEALSHTGLGLDFKINLDIEETNLMNTTADSVLKLAELPEKRFSKNENGIERGIKAKDVLGYILKVFNCKIYQENNFFYIEQRNSTGIRNIYTYSFSTLIKLNEYSENNDINISGLKFESSNELSKLRPIKSVEATYINKNVPTNLVTNPNFDNNDISFFNKYTQETTTFSINGVNDQLAITRLQGVDPIPEVKIGVISNLIPIEKKGDSDKISLEFDFKLDTIDYVSDFKFYYLEVSIISPDGFIQSVLSSPLSDSVKTFKASFDQIITGNYQILITCKLDDKINSIDFRLDNFKLFAIPEGVEENQISTYDRFISITNNDSNAIDTKEIEFYVGDGIEKSDTGNLRIADTLTTDWNSSGLNLIQLSILDTLKHNASYLNNVKLSIINTSYTNIKYSNRIVFDGKIYRIKDYGQNYNKINPTVNLELVEIKESIINYTFDNKTLTSAEGEDTNTVNNSQKEIDPTVPEVVKSINQTNIDYWNNKPDSLTLQQVTDFGNTTNRSLIINDDVGTETARIKNTGVYNGVNFVFNGTASSGGSTGSGIWGQISGTLSDQTDLQTALDGKVSLSGTETITGVKTFSTNAIFNSNVGIGTTSPIRRLDIKASVSDESLFRLSHPTAPTNAGFEIGFKSGNDNIGLDVEYGNAIKTAIEINRESADVTIHNKLNVQNLGIGTTTPTEKLDVNGNIKASGTVTATNFVFG